MMRHDVEERVIPPTGLPALLGLPAAPAGLVVFAHGSGSSRLSPRNNAVAEDMRARGLGTLLFDLLTPEEAADRRRVFDIPFLAQRLGEATCWAATEAATAGLPIGYFGASTGAAAALAAAADPGSPVRAVVSRGGRPDLAGGALPAVRAPTLLVVGGEDREVIVLNRMALARLRASKQLEIVPGATHLFEEPGTLEAVTQLAVAWFTAHLRPGPT